jgi:hypothetical protein
MRQTVVQLEVRGILPLIGRLKLEGIVLVEEFEVPLSRFSN